MRKIILFVIFFIMTLEIIAFTDQFVTSIINPPFSKIEIHDEYGTRGKAFGSWRNIKLNKFGFNDSFDYEQEKTVNEIRIMILGDSITFGTFTYPYTWPNFLQKELIKKNENFKVINASMPGNSYSNIVSRFIYQYIDFQPDYLIIYKGFRSYMVPEEIRTPEKGNSISNILCNSNFLRKLLLKQPGNSLDRLIKERKKRSIEHLILEVPSVGYTNYLKDLERIHELCKKTNIQMILTEFPTLTNERNFEKYKEELYDTLYYYPQLSISTYINSKTIFNHLTRDFSTKNEIPYLYLQVSLNKEKLHFLDDYHLSVEGERIVSKIFAEYILNMNNIQ